MHLLTMAMVMGVALLLPFTILALLTRESDRRSAPEAPAAEEEATPAR